MNRSNSLCSLSRW